MTAKTSFGQWLKQHRKMLDLTREELAARVGCAADTIYRIEIDGRRPSKQIAELLAAHLNIPPAERAAFVTFARSGVLRTRTVNPWNTPFHPPSNLLLQPVPLVGREEAVLAVRKRLSQNETRLLTLIGPPGVGKTSLALQVAIEALDDYADGVFFVALAPISDANLVLTTISSVLGIPDAGPRTPLERLKVVLRDKQMLLVLDNFEQILAAASQLAELLNVCPWLKLLVTSRAALRIRQERQIPVNPLSVPNLAEMPTPEMLPQYAAIQLFMERAQTVKPDFVLTAANAGTVATICVRLDGLPLAILLISARIKLLPPAALLERLNGRLLLQSDGLRDIEPRHRTLNNAIDWSYRLLNTEEQTLFRRLSVFVGGWTLDAAEAICVGNLNLSGIDGLASLLDKSLIKQEAISEDEPRFMMLETIREYALEQLIASGELDRVRLQHLSYFVNLAESAEAHVFGREQIAWFDRLDTELDNLRAALAWSQDSETGLRLAGALGWFFNKRTHWNEGLDWLERMLAANPNASASLRAKGFQNAGKLARCLGDEPQSQALYEQALALARPMNDRRVIAWILTFLGNYRATDLDWAATCVEESLALFREMGDSFGLGYALYNRAYCALDQKDYAYVQGLIEELESIAREAADLYLLAEVSYLRGRVAWHEQDHQWVKRHYETSLAFFREAHDLDGISRTIVNLAAVEQAMGNMDRARILNEEALLLHKEISLDHPRVPFIFCGLAGIAISRGQFERAARLLGAAKSDWLAQFASLHPEIAPFEQEMAVSRAHLGDTAFAVAWEEGGAMTPEQAIAYALEGSQEVTYAVPNNKSK